MYNYNVSAVTGNGNKMSCLKPNSNLCPPPPPAAGEDGVGGGRGLPSHPRPEGPAELPPWFFYSVILLQHC